MPIVNQDVAFIPVSHSLASTSSWHLIAIARQSQNKTKPPVKLLAQREGDRETYLWYITEDEYLRLNQIFVGRDFQETGLGGTKVVGLPSPCGGCGKYTEFIDWWAAVQRSTF